MKHRTLALNFGPDAVCLTVDPRKDSTFYRLGWMDLGRAVSGHRASAVTVHTLDGKYGVSVDEDKMRTFDPNEFELLFTRFGERGA